MGNLNLEKIVISGWDNFTASIVERINIKFPLCTIYCTDTPTPEIQEAIKNHSISPLPNHKNEIYENAQYIIINQDSQTTLDYLESINTLIDYSTFVMDFQTIKSYHIEKVSRILENDKNYISCYVFLDNIPQNFTIRGDLFRDKIVAVISDTSTPTLQEIRDFWNIFGAKIVPTSAEFFDEIFAETSQTLSLLSHVFSHILLQDSWSDTLFFGFYNKDLRSFLAPVDNCHHCSANHVIQNAENIRRNISFIRRELDKLDEMIDNEEILKLEKYFDESSLFKDRL